MLFYIMGLEEVRWIDCPSVRDERGVLTSIESGIDTPFPVRRVFYMHHVVTDRGGHAHQDTDQVVIAVSGGFRITLADGKNEREYALSDATRGLYIPRMVFITLFDFSPGAVCLVLASTHYDIKRSFRNWADYLKAVSGS
jgi:dTDP-4-dehydrorhamnose 3,5-epimerase-like enzyme